MASATAMIVRSGCRGVRLSRNPSCWKKHGTASSWLVNHNNSNNSNNNDVFVWNHNHHNDESASSSASMRMGSCRSFSSSSVDVDADDSDKEESESKNGDDLIMSSLLENYDPELVMSQLRKACQWNQGSNNRRWDYEFVRTTVDDYERHLRYILAQKKLNDSNSSGGGGGIIGVELSDSMTSKLLSSDMTECALKAAIKMKVDTMELSKRIRELERLIGTIGLTPLTDNLSLALLEANGKAGNVGRAISLLQLRKQRGYEPRGTKEFRFAVQSIQSAGLYLRKSGRNIYYTNHNNNNNNNRSSLSNKKDGPTTKNNITHYDLDNPTRWLDAILLNMSSRNFQLTPSLANRMLDCYATTGKTGKALHFFYKVVQKEQNNDVDVDVDDDDGDTNDNNHTAEFQRRKTKVRMKMLRPPPYTKIPSQQLHGKQVIHQFHNEDKTNSSKISKLEQEKQRNWSIPLTAAFAFADSLTYGACSHDPIRLNLLSYNTLMKVCCYRGALWRAFEILEELLPKQGLKPDTYTYNTLLAALARVGDAKTMREILTSMTNNNVPIDSYTVQAISDGFLNVGDIGGAITLVQDSFNQHNVLPPYTTHLKILEFALANDLVFEAKRHVYFIQQLWKWDPSSSPSSSIQFQNILKLTQKNPKLSKVSLQRMFTYFGEELPDSDFF